MTPQAKQLALELERAAVNFTMSDPARELMVKVAEFLNGNRPVPSPAEGKSP